MEKAAFSFTVGGNVNEYKHVENRMKIMFIRKLEIELSCDLIILLLPMYPRKEHQ
jgi:hypothetical protein